MCEQDLRPVHTERLRHHHRNIDRQNGYATHSAHHSSPIKNIKGAARQRYGDGYGIAWCEWAFNNVIIVTIDL